MAADPAGDIRPYLRTQARSDDEIRKLLKAAARSIKKDLDTPIKNAIAAEQPQLVMRAIEGRLAGLWTETEGVILNYRPQVALDAVKVGDPISRALFEVAGVDYKPIQQSLQERALFAVEAGLNRFSTQNIPLSSTVHRASALADGWLDRRISQLITQGANARTIARSIEQFILPDVPGGVSYAAMRVARTELNTTFHRVQREVMGAQPWVSKVAWVLSGSHPEEDECDDLVGEYELRDAPDPPHPQCLCHLEPVMMGKDEFVAYVSSPQFIRDFGSAVD